MSRIARLVRVERQGVTLATMTYNAAGQLLTQTDANGKTTAYAYDAFGALLQVTDAQGTVMTNTYNSAGELGSVTDGKGNVTSYTYDIDYPYDPNIPVIHLGRLTRVTSGVKYTQL